MSFLRETKIKDYMTRSDGIHKTVTAVSKFALFMRETLIIDHDI